MALRKTMSMVGALLALSMAVGALAALLWVNFVTLPVYEVRADGRAIIDDQGLASIIAADAVYVELGLVTGIALGIVSWLWFRDLGWPVAFIATAASLLSGLTCWWLGGLASPGSFEERLASATEGDVVPVALEVHSPAALAVWSFAAVAVPLFAASLGPESRRAAATKRNAPEPAGDAAFDD